MLNFQLFFNIILEDSSSTLHILFIKRFSFGLAPKNVLEIIDKYIGDAIMAFFGAPVHLQDHAKHACRSALQQLSKLSELQEEYKQKGPIERVRATILEKKLADEEALDLIDQQVKQQIADAVAFAEASAFPQPAAAYTDVYTQKNYPFLKS